MGRNESRVQHDPVTQADLDRYALAEQQLAQMQVPLLLDNRNPHQRLYIAAMDGTGNSIYKDAEENWSAVGKIYKQVRDSKPNGIAAGYVEGIGTQDDWLPNKWDGLTGHTFDARLETAYHQFCVQAYEWLKKDPQAEIRVTGLGFSRGAELSAALSKIIHERGIMNPEDAKIQWQDGLVQKAEYTRGHLVPPGQTLQTLTLFDPVATNITEHDRRIPPSVISGIALMSEDRRDQFKGTRFFPDGMSEDNRFFSVTLPGAHSDVGNSYAKDGLGRLSHNLAVDYINSQSSQDLLKKQKPSQDLSQYVIHRSEEHMAFYTTRGFRDGQRDFIDQLGPEQQCRITPQPDCTQKVPHDAQLADKVNWQSIRIQPTDTPPRMQTEKQAKLDDPIESMFMRMTDAALQGDSNKVMQAGREYQQSAHGQEWLKQGQNYNQEQQAALEKQQAEQLAQQQQLEQQQAEIRRSHVMKM